MYSPPSSFDPNDPRNQLPTAPPSFAQTPPTPLPAAPKRPGLFDKEHRSDTLLAIGSGLLGGFNFGDGVAAAGQNVLGLKKQLRAEQVKGHEYGGPDNSFDISIDPVTGVRTATPNAAMQAYLERKNAKPKDAADINGRAMYALQQQPEATRAATYAQMRANPTFYGIDPRTMPAEYDPVYTATAAGMGQTVAQATAASRAAERDEATDAYRAGVSADRTRRTGIYENRATATTAQGAARLAQGSERIAISRTKGGGKAKAGGKRSSSNSDLSYIQ